MPVIRSYKGPLDSRRISYETRLAARRRYEEWEQRFQQAQFQNAVPQGYEQQLAAPGIVAGGCYQQEQDWYPRTGGTFVVKGGRLCRTDGERRALNLLRRHLNEDQWECLSQHRYFWITGYMRHYGRMREHLFQITPYGVFEVKEGAGRRSFCIVTMEPGMPEADWMLCVKLLIESNLKKFFATAKTRGWQTFGCNQTG